MIRVRREIDRLSMDEGEKLRRVESLQYQMEEIQRAKLDLDISLFSRKKD